MSASKITCNLSDIQSFAVSDYGIESGYIWRTTGSDKTPTSFNAATLAIQRGTLLPKQLSGELSITCTEQTRFE